MDVNCFEALLLLFCLFECVYVSVTQNNNKFHRNQRFTDVYCSNGVVIVGETVSAILCGFECINSNTCTGIFYNWVTRSCSIASVVSVPELGCHQQTGSNYYVRMSFRVFDTYNFTPADQSRLSTETVEQICESYKYHSLKSEVDATNTLCGSSSCCKSRGCHSGVLQHYSNTWSLTTTGTICQRWDQQVPHGHGVISTGTPNYETLTEAQNYCRDPDYTGVLWCYTLDPNKRWETCGIPTCP